MALPHFDKFCTGGAVVHFERKWASEMAMAICSFRSEHTSKWKRGLNTARFKWCHSRSESRFSRVSMNSVCPTKTQERVVTQDGLDSLPPYVYEAKKHSEEGWPQELCWWRQIEINLWRQSSVWISRGKLLLTWKFWTKFLHKLQGYQVPFGHQFLVQEVMTVFFLGQDSRKIDSSSLDVLHHVSKTASNQKNIPTMFFEKSCCSSLFATAFMESHLHCKLHTVSLQHRSKTDTPTCEGPCWGRRLKTSQWMMHAERMALLDVKLSHWAFDAM